MAMTTTHHGSGGSTASLKEWNGVHAPVKTIAATLESRSITDEKTAASVCLLKNPSHANAVPQQNVANRSSEPSNVVVPIVSKANDTYCAT